MDINLKSLIGKLNDVSRRALESAAGLCLSRTNYNVEIEHWLLKILELNDSDFGRLLRYYEIDPSHLSRDITRSVDKFKTGNTRPPLLSTRIVDLVRQAWIIASIDFGAPQVRTGHMLLALFNRQRIISLDSREHAGLGQDFARGTQAGVARYYRRIGRRYGSRTLRRRRAQSPGARAPQAARRRRSTSSRST